MNYVEISYSKRRPKKIENDVFVLYTPKRIKLQCGEIKIVDMKQSNYQIIKLSKNLVGSCVLLPSLTSQNIKLLSAYHNSTLEDSSYRAIFEIQNRNMNETNQLKAKTELFYHTK